MLSLCLRTLEEDAEMHRRLIADSNRKIRVLMEGVLAKRASTAGP